MNHRDWAALCFIPATVCVAPVFAQDYLSVAQAQHALFPKADSFVDSTIVLTSEQRDRIKALSGVRQRQEKPPVWKAMLGGKLQGWLLVDEVIGKHEFITYATAISPDGTVLGVEVMSYRETHGGQVRDAAWLAHFTGKHLTDAFKLDQDVPNISGATLSCRNITDGVKRLLALHKVALSS